MCTITAPTVTGPANDPRPTSSMPTTLAAPPRSILRSRVRLGRTTGYSVTDDCEGTVRHSDGGQITATTRPSA